MRERPILFSAPMVRAILEGRKTQTRRAVKPQWSADVDEVSERPALDRVLKCVVSGHSGEWEDDHSLGEIRRCPYGQPGDRLWVRETWQELYDPNGKRTNCFEQTFPPTPHSVIYRATDERPEGATWHWRPSIFMRRWMSRITLEVMSVRVERLQAISAADAKAEGLDRYEADGRTYYRLDHWERSLGCADATEVYRRLWESINGPGSWAANPWVWAVEFRRVTP